MLNYKFDPPFNPFLPSFVLQMKEALDALESEREQKYEIKKKLEEKINNDSILNISNFGLRFPGLTGFGSKHILMHAQSHHNPSSSFSPSTFFSPSCLASPSRYVSRNYPAKLETFRLDRNNCSTPSKPSPPVVPTSSTFCHKTILVPGLLDGGPCCDLSSSTAFTKSFTNSMPFSENILKGIIDSKGLIINFLSYRSKPFHAMKGNLHDMVPLISTYKNRCCKRIRRKVRLAGWLEKRKQRYTAVKKFFFQSHNKMCNNNANRQCAHLDTLPPAKPPGGQFNFLSNRLDDTMFYSNDMKGNPSPSSRRLFRQDAGGNATSVLQSTPRPQSLYSVDSVGFKTSKNKKLPGNAQLSCSAGAGNKCSSCMKVTFRVIVTCCLGLFSP